MAQPEGRVVLDEAEAQQAAERYAQMEAELQALRQRNEELIRDLQEQQTLLRRNAYVPTEDQGLRPKSLPTSPQNCWPEDKGRRYS